MNDRRSADGRGLGAVLIVLGVLFILIGLVTATIIDGVPRLFVLAPALVTLGISLVILPGSREVSLSAPGARWLKESPWFHKIAWVASGLGGFYLGIRFIVGA